MIPVRIEFDGTRFIAFTVVNQEPVLLEGIKKCIYYRDAALLSKDLLTQTEDSLAKARLNLVYIQNLLDEKEKSCITCYKEKKKDNETILKLETKNKRKNNVYGGTLLIVAIGFVVLTTF